MTITASSPTQKDTEIITNQRRDMKLRIRKTGNITRNKLTRQLIMVLNLSCKNLIMPMETEGTQRCLRKSQNIMNTGLKTIIEKARKFKVKIL